MLIDIRCPNCNYIFWLSREYLIENCGAETEISVYKCKNYSCLNNNCLRPNLANLMILENRSLQDYKLPCHYDDKIYYVNGYQGINRTVILVENGDELNRIFSVDVFHPLNLSQTIQDQLRKILARTLKLSKFQ